MLTQACWLTNQLQSSCCNATPELHNRSCCNATPEQHNMAKAQHVLSRGQFRQGLHCQAASRLSCTSNGHVNGVCIATTTPEQLQRRGLPAGGRGHGQRHPRRGVGRCRAALPGAEPTSLSPKGSECAKAKLPTPCGWVGNMGARCLPHTACNARQVAPFARGPVHGAVRIRNLGDAQTQSCNCDMRPPTHPKNGPTIRCCRHPMLDPSRDLL